VGRKGYHHPANMTRAGWDAWAAQPEDEPVRLPKVGALGYWRYQGPWYVEDENLTGANLRALLVTQDQLRDARLNRARTIAAMAESPAPTPVRGAIPDHLRLLVWTRDAADAAAPHRSYNSTTSSRGAEAGPPPQRTWRSSAAPAIARRGHRSHRSAHLIRSVEEYHRAADTWGGHPPRPAGDDFERAVTLPTRPAKARD
jgi:hypothetical protein